MAVMESQTTLKKGNRAPDFDLLGIDDKKHSLSSFVDSKPLLVIFMCNHCPFVKAKIDTMKDIHAQFGNDVNIVGINSNDAIKYPDDSFEDMKMIAKEKGIKFDYLVDESQDVAQRYGAVCTPDPFLFDKDHKLVFHGRLDNAMKPEDVATEKTMEQNIQKLLNYETIEKDFEPSIGCSIKWKE